MQYAFFRRSRHIRVVSVARDAKEKREKTNGRATSFRALFAPRLHRGKGRSRVRAVSPEARKGRE